MPENERPSLPDKFVWLSDAPLFIDAEQVGRFYDAVARPLTKEGAVTVEITDETVNDLKGKLGLEVGLTTETLAGMLAPLLAFVRPKITASGGVEGERKSSTGRSYSYELATVDTPQSQLEALTLFYLGRYTKRIFFPESPSKADWRDAASVSGVPRPFVFLNLPGHEEAIANNLKQTKLIPTAAEFQNGKIVLIYPMLLAANGERPPTYPEEAGSPEQLRSERTKYWSWFDKNFSATRAMNAIEQAASENGRIRWIDYRVPLTSEGDTLHLHVRPSGNYDTGVLAYNFVKRGFKHGVRLIGTLRSEPDMNVLAIYEK
jgi:hypothetical protein